MRLAFIDVTATVSVGGIQTAIWSLARELAASGHRVDVVGGTGQTAAALAEPGISVHTFPFVSRHRFPNFGTRFRKLAERLSFYRNAGRSAFALQPDWIVLTKPLDFFWAASRLRPASTRVAFMSGGTDFFPGDRTLARRVDAMAACSHFNGWQVYTRYGRYPKVIYNGVDCARFSPAARDPALRPRLGLSDDDLVLAFAGRLVGWKGIQYAIEATRLALRDGIAAKLLLVGGGAMEPALRRQAQEAGLAERVIFCPPVAHAELPPLYAAADIGVFPSIGDEAFGITIAEAMSCGLPVIASHVGGIPEVVGNEGSCGILVTPANAREICSALTTLAAQPDERRAMGERARRRIESLFTWRGAAQRLLTALDL